MHRRKSEPVAIRASLHLNLRYLEKEIGGVSNAAGLMQDSRRDQLATLLRIIAKPLERTSNLGN
jgi:hypothetical protein